jgi:serine/threonine-protein kinase
MGTPRYMAPEQWRGRGVDHRADVFALGVVAFEMLTGKAPFERETVADLMMAVMGEDPPPPSQVLPSLPAVLDRPLLAMMARDPNLRPASAGAAVTTLSQALGMTDTGVASIAREDAPRAAVPSTGPTELATNAPVSMAPSTSKKSPLVPLAVLGVLLAAGGVGFFLLRRSGEPAAERSDTSTAASAPPHASAPVSAAETVAPAVSLPPLAPGRGAPASASAAPPVTSALVPAAAPIAPSAVVARPAFPKTPPTKPKVKPSLALPVEDR